MLYATRLKGELVLSGVNLRALKTKVKVRLLREAINTLYEIWRKGGMKALGI